MQKMKNIVVGIIAGLSLILCLGEPAEDTSLVIWAIWEVVNLSIFAVSCKYLSKHLPEEYRDENI